MKKELVGKWAKTLVGYSLKRQFLDRGEELYGKKILVKGEVISEPLMVALEEEIIKHGGFADIQPFFSNHHRRNPFAGIPALEHGNQAQIEFVPDFAEGMFKEMDGFVNIIGTVNPRGFEKNLTGLKSICSSVANINDIVTEESVWTLTKFPTIADAKLEGLNILKYRNFILKSSIIDYAEMEERQKELSEFFKETKDIVVKSFNPLENRICELSMSKGDNLGESCYGTYNVPDGEVFTSPYANTVNGEVYLDIPIYSGVKIGGVYLKFKDGLIVDYSAQEGHEMLKEIIETDSDSRKLGEFALGTNFNITQNLMEILFTEKIGGTIHLAIGSSYDEAYPSLQGISIEEKNVERERLKALGLYSHSDQHVDIPCDFRNPRKGEGIYFDGKPVVWNGMRWNF